MMRRTQNGVVRVRDTSGTKCGSAHAVYPHFGKCTGDCAIIPYQPPPEMAVVQPGVSTPVDPFVGGGIR